MSPEQTFLDFWLLNIATWLSQRNCNPSMFRKKLLLLWCFYYLWIMSPFFHFCDPEMWASSSFPLPPLLHVASPAPSPAHLIFFPTHLFSVFPAIILGQVNSIPYLNYFKCYSIFLPLGSLQLIYHTTAEVMFAKTLLMLPISTLQYLLIALRFTARILNMAYKTLHHLTPAHLSNSVLFSAFQSHRLLSVFQMYSVLFIAQDLYICCFLGISSPIYSSPLPS